MLASGVDHCTVYAYADSIGCGLRWLEGSLGIFPRFRVNFGALRAYTG
jgi:hypothetical protein